MSDELKEQLRVYRDVDNEIRKINTDLYQKREERNKIESNISVILEAYTDIQKIKIDDGSYIRIKRPNTWSKPWVLSKNNLETYLAAYFQKTSTPNAKECFEFITNEVKTNSVSDKYSIERVIADTD